MVGSLQNEAPCSNAAWCDFHDHSCGQEEARIGPAFESIYGKCLNLESLSICNSRPLWKCHRYTRDKIGYMYQSPSTGGPNHKRAVVNPVYVLSHSNRWQTPAAKAHLPMVGAHWISIFLAFSVSSSCRLIAAVLVRLYCHRAIKQENPYIESYRDCCEGQANTRQCHNAGLLI